MATLTAWAFPGVNDAEQAIAKLQGLQSQQLINIQDAAVVSWEEGKKKPKTRQLNNLAGAGALGGAFWGMLFGLLFFVPILVAQLVPDARGMLLVWALGGVLALAGAMAYAELAALEPRAGGEYVYLRAAFGPLVGFLSGWTSFVAGFSGAIAASCGPTLGPPKTVAQ